MIKVLFMTVPRVYFDRSMHDRTTDFGETIQYMINQFDSSKVEVDIMDFSIMGCTYRYVYSQLHNDYDLIVMFTDIPDAFIARKVGLYLKEISPKTKLFIYGDATLVIPQYLKRKPFDAFYLRGDEEAVIVHYLNTLIGSESLKDIKGLCYLDAEGNYVENDGYYRIKADDWAFPTLNKLPIDQYNDFAHSFRGNDYVCAFYVSKGCRRGCKYCLCYKREGKDERWRDVNSCVDFIEQNAKQFRRFKLHAANLAGNRQWLIDFSHEMIRRGLNKVVKWKGTICLSDMDYELAKICSEGGAYSFGFGVESFFKDSNKGVKFSVKEFEDKLSMLNKIPIRWKGYVMFNMPNQTIEDLNFTTSILKKNNVVVRASAYTPFYLLEDKDNSELDAMNLELWNKKEFLPWQKNEDSDQIWKAYVSELRI